MIWNNIWNKLMEWSEASKQFLLDNSNKAVIIYSGLFLLGIAVFFFAYNTLHDDNKRL